MASGLDQAVIGNFIDASNGNATFTEPSTGLNVRQMTTEGSSTSAGTELGTSGGYTAGGNSVTMGNAAAYTSGHRTASNSAAVTITNMLAATIIGVETSDQGGTPKRFWWGDLTSNVTTNSGDTLTARLPDHIPHGSVKKQEIPQGGFHRCPGFTG